MLSKKLLKVMEIVSHMLNEAGPNLHNAEFTAGCLQHLPPQLGNELEQHVGCGVNNEKVNCGSGVLAVALVDTDNIQNFVCC